MNARTRFTHALLAGGSFFVFASAANAQTAPAPSPAGATLETIVVTGSRLPSGGEMPTPVTILSASDLLTRSPGSVVDALQALPYFSNSSGAVSGGSTNGSGLYRTLNLRNLGANRVLTLFNGHRVTPTSTGGVVNQDFIPSLLLERVDVVTGGVSAVYGSDAVAGVVNYITDRDFVGVKGDVQGGVSDYGDGLTGRFAIAAGAPLFGERAHILGSYEYSTEAGIDHKTSRPWGADVWTIAGAGTTANPFLLVRNARALFYGTQWRIGSGPLADMMFKENGILSPFTHGTPTGTANLESGGDGYFFDNALSGTVKTHKAFSRVDFDVNDNVHVYADVVLSYGHTETYYGEVGFYRPVNVGNRNYYLDPRYQALLPDPNGSFSYGKLFRGDLPLSEPTAALKTRMIDVGADGEIAGWKWDVTATFGSSGQNARLDRNINYLKAYAATDVVADPVTGNPVCNVTLTHPGLYPGCVPANIFGPSATSRAAYDYFTGSTYQKTTTDMTAIAGSLAGSPISLWAGPVEAALSFEWRDLKTRLDSNSGTTATDCTGIRFGNCVVGTTTLWFQTAAPLRGSQKAYEGAVEVKVPLISDWRFAQDVSATAAARWTHYDRSGGVVSWKAGAEWRIDDQIRLRANRSRDIRAPNLQELFAVGTPGVVSTLDLHTNTSALVGNITSGNQNLVPEIANTLTVGAVLEPEFLEAFSLTVDFYSIKLTNGIGTVSGRDLTTQRLCEESNGTSPLCSLIIRPLPFSDRTPANYPTAWLSSPVNAATSSTSGIDVEANYHAQLLSGDLRLRGLVTYQPHYRTQLTPASNLLDVANSQQMPRTRADFTISYAWNGITASVQERWRSSTGWGQDSTQVFRIPKIPSVAFTNVNLEYAVLEEADIFLNVRNLFNKQPPPAPQSAPITNVGFGLTVVPGDDVLGRFFTAGIRFRM